MFGNKNSVLKHSHQKRAMKRVHSFLLVLLFSLLGLSLAIAILSSVSRNTDLHIKNINVFGVEALSERAIQEEARTLMAGSYMGLFPKEHILLFPKEKILQGIAVYPRVREVSLDRVFPHSIDIHLEERKPFLLWCRSASDRPSRDGGLSDECFLSDDTGVIFDRAPSFSGDVYYHFVSVLPDNVPGTQPLIETDFRALIGFKDALSELGFPSRALSLGTDGIHSFLLENGIELRFKKDGNFSALLDVLDSAKENIPDTVREYIDLTFENKVVYK